MKTLKLDYPIKWGEETISELKFNRPKGKHIRHVTTSPTIGELLDIAAKCCDHDSGSVIIDELDACDATKVADMVGDFLEGGQKTGQKS